ncbi:hypothetical protein PLCT1_01009 [Planctomycetaceae bacterium]|nr:hypothetical protein PLCT1_01009 [Planctomycetaceae bacterium]
MSESAAPTLKAARKPSASWINVRALLRGPRLRQSPQALKAASRMVLFLPILQTALLVGVLNSELWLGLLGLEGLLMGALASSQLSQRDAQYRLLGLGIAFVNTLALAGFGLFVNSHAFWISGTIGFLPAMALVLLPTGARTVKLAWAGYSLSFLLLFGASGFARFCIETAGGDEVAARRLKLEFAWAAFVVRGGNGTERALLRLRMAQAAFAENDFEAAFHLADDGLRHKDGRWRDLPASPIAESLFQSQLSVKAQAFYNAAWNKNEPYRAVIKPDPLDASTLSECRVKWGF